MGLIRVRATDSSECKGGTQEPRHNRRARLERIVTKDRNYCEDVEREES